MSFSATLKGTPVGTATRTPLNGLIVMFKRLALALRSNSTGPIPSILIVVDEIIRYFLLRAFGVRIEKRLSSLTFSCFLTIVFTCNQSVRYNILESRYGNYHSRKSNANVGKQAEL